MRMMFLNHSFKRHSAELETHIQRLLKSYASPETTFELAYPEDLGGGEVLSLLEQGKALSGLHHILETPGFGQKSHRSRAAKIRCGHPEQHLRSRCRSQPACGAHTGHWTAARVVAFCSDDLRPVRPDRAAAVAYASYHEISAILRHDSIRKRHQNREPLRHR